MTNSDHIAIVGGGFSGSLLAINLLRHDGPRATLIERRSRQLGRGVAYSAAHPSHLLNVRAGNMSALPDDPDHFVRWLAARGEGDRATFVPRTTYGLYLREMLDEAIVRSNGRLVQIEGEVTALDGAGATQRLTMADDGVIAVDRVVLALGNLPPHTPPGLDPAALPGGVYRADPWASDIAEGLRADDVVVLIDTGLTAVDAALLLDARGFGGMILAVSRRGLAPRRHVDGGIALPGLLDKPQGGSGDIIRQVRGRAAQHGWRAAVDELRPVTQMLWASAPEDLRARFLRHLRPYWDVHRHRLAPRVADRIDALVAEGRLRFTGGRLVDAVGDGSHADLRWRPRGEAQAMVTRTARIVNCTGPQGDLLRSDESLIRHLVATGTIRPDPLRLGLDVDAQSHALRADGGRNERLYAIGPMTRGGLWEVVAVPDIRQQAWSLARRLSNAHWVGGEGL
ncbi:FAD/NAD(P)-binding protein [Sphingomonas naphthae]|uniref:FAD/NAD(P)-binding protein n=1 Tax=Sphingomonas naphthae TaxID=1813468 RepID=A0ABY7TJ44_9SPHN|nr:FAD/NAD(P)-binding protein [Sphingomonas naphthae]WCT72821.1 FAD/NAD(P)-binding protein [Sphingomonas naphthae]